MWKDSWLHDIPIAMKPTFINLIWIANVNFKVKEKINSLAERFVKPQRMSGRPFIPNIPITIFK